MTSKVRKIGTEEDLDKIIKRSVKKPVFIFIHDVTIPESDAAYQEYLNFIEDNEDDILFRVIYMREDMEVSKAMEEKLDIPQEAPQLLLMMDEEIVWDDRKENITFENLVDVTNEYISL